MESQSAEERLASLNFMVKTNLIQDKKIREGVLSYTESIKNTPQLSPQFKSYDSLPSPLYNHSQIFLLSGNKTQNSLLDSINNELKSVGFNIIGKKMSLDPGRPQNPEVRYYYKEDQTQAILLVGYLTKKLSIQNIEANYFEDDSVERGYIEIWIGNKVIK